MLNDYLPNRCLLHLLHVCDETHKDDILHRNSLFTEIYFMSKETFFYYKHTVPASIFCTVSSEILSYNLAYNPFRVQPVCNAHWDITSSVSQKSSRMHSIRVNRTIKKSRTTFDTLSAQQTLTHPFYAFGSRQCWVGRSSVDG